MVILEMPIEQMVHTNKRKFLALVAKNYGVPVDEAENYHDMAIRGHHEPRFQNRLRDKSLTENDYSLLVKAEEEFQTRVAAWGDLIP